MIIKNGYEFFEPNDVCVEVFEMLEAAVKLARESPTESIQQIVEGGFGDRVRHMASSLALGEWVKAEVDERQKAFQKPESLS